MKKYREDIKTMGEVVFFILIYLSLATFHNPVYSYLTVTIYSIYWSTNFYSKIHYRKGKADYILFPTKNDEYSRMTSIMIGSMVIIAAMTFLIWKKSFSHYTIIGFSAGILVLLNGIMDLPKGKLLIKNNTVLFSGLKESIAQDLLKEIQISNEQIRIKTTDDKTWQINNLQIDSQSARLIASYLDQRITHTKFKLLNQID